MIRAGINFRIGFGITSSTPRSSFILEVPYAVSCETMSLVMNLKKWSTLSSLRKNRRTGAVGTAVPGPCSLQCFLASLIRKSVRPEIRSFNCFLLKFWANIDKISFLDFEDCTVIGINKIS